MSSQAIETLTDFGDLAVTLPLSMAMLLWLAHLRRWREAGWWVAALALCIGVTALSKIIFYACPLVAHLSSPSGHTSMSTLVYGAIVAVCAAEFDGWRRGAIVAAGAAFVVAIAASRVALMIHSAVEVAAGLTIGGVSLALFTWQYLRRPPAMPSLRPLVVASIAVMALLHGQELRAETMLHFFSSYFEVAKACGTENTAKD